MTWGTPRDSTRFSSRARYSRASSRERSVGGSGSRIGSAFTHRAPPMSAWPLPKWARYSPRIMKASAPVGSSAESPRRATVPTLPNLPSMRGTSRTRRLPWRAASIAAFWPSLSTDRVTDMWGRTITSSMGRTGRSSDFGVAICTRERLPRLGHSQSCSGALNPGHASARGAAPGDGVDRDRGKQNEPGHDVLVLEPQPLQVHAVVDSADHEAAQDAVERLAAAAHEAGASDDRRRHGIKDVLAALHVVRHPAEERGVKKHRDACRDGAQGERDRAHDRKVDAGSPGRLRVTPDGVDVTAIASSLEEDGPDGQDDKHDRYHVGHAGEEAKAGPVGVADRDHDHRDDGDHPDLRSE